MKQKKIDHLVKPTTVIVIEKPEPLIQVSNESQKKANYAKTKNG